MNSVKRAIPILLAVAMLAMLSACGSSEPCKSCGNTPTKGIHEQLFWRKRILLFKVFV